MRPISRSTRKQKKKSLILSTFLKALDDAVNETTATQQVPSRSRVKDQAAAH